jgi:flagellar hook-associated protein 2
MSDAGINTNNLITDANGRVRFSGLGSGIDFNAAVDAMIEARRIPVDRLETQIEERTAKVKALDSLRTLMTNMRTSLNNLYGRVSLGNVGNVFETKSTFASTSREDGASPSNAANLIGVSVTNAAEAGTHEIEIDQTARSHRIGGATFDSLTSDLGTASGGAAGSVSGSFDVNGVTITVDPTDTLLSLRDRINGANSGDDATGVRASIVTVNDGENVLVLTAEETGENITLDNETGGVLAGLGISTDGGATLSNELQTPRTAQFYADGLLEQDKWHSRKLNAGAELSTFGVGASGPYSFEIRDASNTLLGTVNYDGNDTVADLAATIDAIAGVSASVVTSGGATRLQITDDGGNPITLTADSGSAIEDLGLTNRQLIERSSNTIDDLFAGTTLTLFGAERGTTIRVEVERDLNAIKTSIDSFVSAYNELKGFINQQQLADPETGEATEEAGPLFRDPTLGEIERRLANVLGSGAEGASPAFSVLAQIGIDFVNNDAIADPLLKDTLKIDETKLDESLLNNIDDIERLFNFEFSSSDPRVTLLNFNGSTSYSSSGYTLNVGGVGSSREDSVEVLDATATLNDGANSVGATTSGSFEINGVAINYDVTTDSLEDLADAINAAGIAGVAAAVVTGDGGDQQLSIASGSDPLTVGSDTGDLLANLSFSTGSYLVGEANVDGLADGSDDGTTTVSGRTITVTDASGAEGLRLLYNGTGDASNVDIDFSIGVGAQMFFELDALLDTESGSLEAARDALNEQNRLAEDRVDQMLERLDFQRDRLLERFIKMEENLSRMNSILDQIREITEAGKQGG